MLSVKRIAIVGAGPSGLAAAKYLEAERAFDDIVIFEQRSTVGGLWYATPHERDDPDFEVPSIVPPTKTDTPVWRVRRRSSSHGGTDSSTSTPDASSGSTSSEDKPQEPVFVSAVYDFLETNTPRPLMTFSDHSFPDGTQLFPKHHEVQAYLEAYGTDVLHLIRFQTQVTDVRPHESFNSQSDKWEVVSRDLYGQKETTEMFDAVVVANGHYTTPFVPEIPGMKEWVAAFPGSITHAKYFRRPADYKDVKVLIVGNYASGTDIANQIMPYCKQPLLVSAKSPAVFVASSDDLKRELPFIASFDAQRRSIIFADGQFETNVEAIIFCTGYIYTLPFLRDLSPAPITDGARVEHSYQHLFYAPRPSLSFLGLQQKVIPFPVAEAQAAVVARVLSSRLSLPSREVMEQWEAEALSKLPEVRGRSAFHAMNFPADARYINMLYDWAASASPRKGSDGSKGEKMPKRWTEWDFQCREQFPMIRRAFAQQGANRSKVTTVEELGFDFNGPHKDFV